MSAATDLDAENGENRVVVAQDGIAIVAIVDWEASDAALREAQAELRDELEYLTASRAVGGDSR